MSPAPPTSLAITSTQISIKWPILNQHTKLRKIKSATHILMVPLGPRLVLRTSCKPLAALMFMWSAADLLSTSAFGFKTFTDIFTYCYGVLEAKQIAVRMREKRGGWVGFWGLSGRVLFSSFKLNRSGLHMHNKNIYVYIIK